MAGPLERIAEVLEGLSQIELGTEELNAMRNVVVAVQGIDKSLDSIADSLSKLAR